MENRKSVLTEDGSHTIYVPELNEHYHSTHGAIQESMHVFIEAGLRETDKREIKILEIGFGTGLNALLSLAEAEEREIKINYTTIERFPLSKETALQLNFSSMLKPSRENEFEMLHKCNWEEMCEITPYFNIKKLNIDATEIEKKEIGKEYDLIFFDAFAPDKQSEMWNETIFKKIFEITAKGGILTTYCAKGEVRRTLTRVGYNVERIPGPPGKREMLRGRKV